MRKMKAVLFDLDGTLTNTLADIAAAGNHALRTSGLPEYPEEAYKGFVGSGVKVLAQRMTASNPEKTEAVLSAYMAYYNDHNQDRTTPYPGIPELLRALAGAGLQLCVFSNKPHHQTEAVVRHYFPDIPFASVRGQMEGVPVKPDPAGALAAAAQLGVAPADFLYLGDTDVDMLCAVRAGMHPLGVLWGFRDAEELRAAGAEALLKTPADCLNFIQL